MYDVTVPARRKLCPVKMGIRCVPVYRKMGKRNSGAAPATVNGELLPHVPLARIF